MLFYVPGTHPRALNPGAALLPARPGAGHPPGLVCTLALGTAGRRIGEGHGNCLLHLQNIYRAGRVRWARPEALGVPACVYFNF